jgi:predicted nucleotidyltransferase
MRIPDLENLKKVFCQYPEIRAVYLFGSRATGRVHRESDLDLAVLQDGDGLQEKKLDILAQLAAEGFCEVDLVFLPKDNIVLRADPSTRSSFVNTSTSCRSSKCNARRSKRGS